MRGVPSHFSDSNHSHIESVPQEPWRFGEPWTGLIRKSLELRMRLLPYLYGAFEECSRTLRDSTGKPPNTMRISLGLASNFADAFAFIAFAQRFVDVPSHELPATPAAA